MSVILSAFEFRKRRDRANTFNIWAMTVGMILGTSLGYFVFIHWFPLYEQNARGFLMSLFGGGLLGGLIPLAVYFYWDETFVRCHPEMKYLEEWKVVMGTIETYPTATHDSATFLLAAEKLQTSALCTNVAFAIRDRVSEMFRAYKPMATAIQDGAYFQFSVAKLEREAEDRNAAYLREWDLFVNKTHVLTEDMGYSNPRVYRESLLKKK